MNNPTTCLASTFFVLAVCAGAAPVTIDFEGVADLTPAPGLYTGQGVDFSSGAVYLSGLFGGSLNELQFPPMVPGQAAFLNDADTTTLTFSQPITSFSGLFTYGGPLTLNFYAAGNVLLTTLTSQYTTNIDGGGGDPGSTPNELIDPGSLSDAVRVDILAPLTDFTLDDLTFDSSQIEPIPEPATGLMSASAVLVLWLMRRRRRGSAGSVTFDPEIRT